MPSFDVTLTISKPLWGEYYHWSLDFRSEEDSHWIVEALGKPHRFVASSDEYDPTSLPRPWKSIHVVHLDNLEIEDIQEIIETVPIRNDLAYWSCQDYVIEILDALEEAGLLKRTAKYEDVKQALLTMVGPVDDTRQRILEYLGESDEHSDGHGNEMEDAEGTNVGLNQTRKERRVLSDEVVVDSDDEDQSMTENERCTLVTPVVENPWNRTKD